jgi:hypothetical protein
MRTLQRVNARKTRKIVETATSVSRRYYVGITSVDVSMALSDAILAAGCVNPG